MTTAYDVPADVLIGKLSAYMKENIKEITPPEWVAHVKTGAHVERVPQVPDFWYVRTASLLRKLYMSGDPIGVQRLRKDYGGRKRRGDHPAHHAKAGGSIIRESLQQLEKAGLVDKVEKSGRVASKKGRSLLDAMSTQIKKDMEMEKPELRAY
jgi:small subunit ribosomal protein S19e